jgi:DNA topoisomerase-1
LQQFETAESNYQSKRNILQAVEAVAKKLGNTKAVCRKCYIHPAVIDAYTDGSLLRVLNRRVKKEMTESLHKLEPEEAAVLGLFRTRLKGVATRNKEA